MKIIIVKDKVSKKELEELAQETYFPMIKGVVDLGSGILAFGGEYHNDARIYLQKEVGSKEDDVWGFNIHTDKPKEEWLEYDSLINIKPVLGNRSMVIQDASVRQRIKDIVYQKLYE